MRNRVLLLVLLATASCRCGNKSTTENKPAATADRLAKAAKDLPDGLDLLGPKQVRAAAETLGVPVVDDLEAYAATLGGGVPASLRP